MTNAFFEPPSNEYLVPDFAALSAADYVEAIKEGIARHTREIQEIAQDPTPATFENTFVALERSGALLREAEMAFANVYPAHGTPEIQAAYKEISALTTAHENDSLQNAELFQRCSAVDASALTGEDARLVSEKLRDFVLAGAQLEQAEKDRIRSINDRVAELSAQFSSRVLAGLNQHALLVTDEAELDGLDASQISAARDAAAEKGLEGWLITLSLFSAQPALSSLTSAEVRARLFERSVTRGLPNSGGIQPVGDPEIETETLSLAQEIATLRAEKAGILGFANYAELALAKQTAPSVEAVDTQLKTLAKAAWNNALAEREKLTAIAGAPVTASDFPYYLEQVRATEFKLDTAALKPYFELDTVLTKGVFYAANKLYGLTFTQRHDIPVYHPDIRVWEVFNEDGSALGLFFGDYFARSTKTGGAWMNSIRGGSQLVGDKPVVTNTMGIPRPPAGQPALLTLDEVNTMFHEFGHALHGLFATATYPSLAGTSVPRDFVEYPSQVNEMWSHWPEVIENYAAHVETGERLPQEILDQLKAASLWGEGFATTEYLGAAILDWAWHSLAPGETVTEPEAFEAEALRAVGFDSAIIAPRYRTGYFQHIFVHQYSAGYYSYIWSEMFDADTVEWFTENGGLNRAAGDTFRNVLLAPGNALDPLSLFRTLRGRDVNPQFLLERRGLAA
ncbi:peptidyl-dipeptidase Dcp [Neomicrococcus aestuarii]|uniref:Peptidyl-dipeptidase Dcp n=1 Tax=Neomicrococcus aestuarii TaxID=556325 RepID=A0A7W8X0S9_9MICC|nr:M3 family metallopeptidase [Neomicrococcus aestuarii]MBB5512029.1 peptidyl-dipeptidase Dcp [Neomicrococcus aestuarii]